MFRSNETAYVKQQYATNANLDARIALHQKFSTASEHFHDWLFNRVQLLENSLLLEIGCGSGALWQHVQHRVPRDWTLVLTDLSFGMLESSRANLQSPVFRLQFLQTDAQSLPFPDQTFDGIFANHMLYHVPDVERALREIRRALKRGGTLYAATNGLTHLRELRELVADISHLLPPAESPEHIFGLENGASILARQFENVTRKVQENDLRVTEVEPLVAYVRSGTSLSVLDEQQTAEFRNRVRSEIKARGAFHITKSVGMFIAR